MIKKRLQIASLFIGLTVSGLAMLAIARPFFVGLFLALTVAIIARPLHRRIAKIISNTTLQTIATMLIILIVIGTPIAIVGNELVNQAQNAYQSYLLPEEGETITTTSQAIVTEITDRLPGSQLITFDLAIAKEKVLTWLTDNINKLFSSAVSVAINTFIFLFALFYLIRDGHILKKTLYELSPLSATNSEQIVKRFEQTVHSVVIGSLVVALIQGGITTIGLLIFGVPEAFLLGSAAVIAALIPGVGPSIIMLPAAVFLYFSGHTIPAAGLAIWSIAIVGTIDNIIRPFLIERGLKIHPFLILISVIGGLIVLGPIGFLAGPIVLSFFLALTDIYIKLEDNLTA